MSYKVNISHPWIFVVDSLTIAGYGARLTRDSLHVPKFTSKNIFLQYTDRL